MLPSFIPPRLNAQLWSIRPIRRPRPRSVSQNQSLGRLSSPFIAPALCRQPLRPLRKGFTYPGHSNRRIHVSVSQPFMISKYRTLSPIHLRKPVCYPRAPVYRLSSGYIQGLMHMTTPHQFETTIVHLEIKTGIQSPASVYRLHPSFR